MTNASIPIVMVQHDFAGDQMNIDFMRPCRPYTIQLLHADADPPEELNCFVCRSTHTGQRFVNKPDGVTDLSPGSRWILYPCDDLKCSILGLIGPTLEFPLVDEFATMAYYGLRNGNPFKD